MKERPINEMLTSSLESISSMIDSNKIIGKPIDVGEDKFIIPISKVTVGFGIGGSEFEINKKNDKSKNELSFEVSEEIFPYGGGELGGMSLNPEAFLVVSKDKSEIVYFEKNPSLFNKTLDLIKEILKK